MPGKLHTDAKHRREIDMRLKMKICDGSMGAYYSSNEIFIVIVKGRGICICAAVYLYLHLHPLQLQLLPDDSPSQKANFSYSSCATQRPHAVMQIVA